MEGGLNLNLLAEIPTDSTLRNRYLKYCLTAIASKEWPFASPEVAGSVGDQILADLDQVQSLGDDTRAALKGELTNARDIILSRFEP